MNIVLVIVIVINYPSHAIVKNSAKKFLDPSMIRICNEMKWFVASEISHHYKKITTIIGDQLLELSPNSYKKLKLSLADKPPDALCKRNGVAHLLKTRSSPYVLPCRIWSFCVKGCRRKSTGKPQILESAGNPLCWDGRRG